VRRALVVAGWTVPKSRCRRSAESVARDACGSTVALPDDLARRRTERERGPVGHDESRPVREECAVPREREVPRSRGGGVAAPPAPH